jgi:UDP-glucose:(heptosyl)LPS alpha-1,3-glucosyltransferase
VSFPEVHRRGGVERIAYECVRFLAGRGHAVAIVANEVSSDLSGPGIIHQAVPALRSPSFLRGWSYHRNANKLRLADAYDVLNTHGCVCPFDGVHWVQSLHVAWLERSASLFGRWSGRRLKQHLNPLHPILLRLERQHFELRRYRKVIATTAQVKDDLHRFYGVPADDVVIIPNGFSPTEFNPVLRSKRREAMRAKLGLREHEVALLFVANELDRKGYPVLLEALRRLKREDLRLIVVGRPDPAIVRQQADAAGVGHLVLACGSAPDVAEYHAAADVFVLPTQYEAFCLAILEALGSGLPVITTRVPGAQDAIADGLNGELVCDPKSAGELSTVVARLLDCAHRSRLSASASASAEAFRWPKVLLRYEGTLLAAAGTSAPSSATATR